MRTIIDNTEAGPEWRIPPLSLGLVLDIKEYAGIDFLEMRGKSADDAKKAAGETLAQLYDPLTMGNTLWCLLKSQAKERGVSERDFGYLFDADSYDDIREKIIGAVVDFTLPPKVAKAVTDDLRRTMDAMQDALIAQLKSSVSASAASSAAIPASSA